MEDVYLTIAYNLYQLLLIADCKDEAEQIYQKHNNIIQYELDYYREQIEYGVETNDEEFASQWPTFSFQLLFQNNIHLLFVQNLSIQQKYL